MSTSKSTHKSTSKSPAHPFAVLGLSPTLDLQKVKQAYFQGLNQHPPHSDPVGFRALRAAYEALDHPERLCKAYLETPLGQQELDQAAAALEQRFGPGLRAAQEQRAAEQERALRMLRFSSATGRLTLNEALRIYG